jgi:hypothetical protein
MTMKRRQRERRKRERKHAYTYKARSMPCPGACCFTVKFSHARREGDQPFGNIGDGARMAEIFVLEDKWTYETYVGNYDGHIMEYHSCKVFDGHRCTEYEKRPNVCAAYPYGYYETGCEMCEEKDGALVARDVVDMLKKSGKWKCLDTGCFEPATYDLIVAYFAA